MTISPQLKALSCFDALLQMTGCLIGLRASTSLGMNIEASVHQPHHVPLHIFVKECVASPSPGTMAEPAYFLIEKHG